MHKFLIYLSIYFCLTCFGLSFSPSSEAGVQFRQWFNSQRSTDIRMKLYNDQRDVQVLNLSGRWHHTQVTKITAEIVTCL
jgi:hypothetical protein